MAIKLKKSIEKNIKKIYNKKNEFNYSNIDIEDHIEIYDAKGKESNTKDESKELNEIIENTTINYGPFLIALFIITVTISIGTTLYSVIDSYAHGTKKEESIKNLLLIMKENPEYLAVDAIKKMSTKDKSNLNSINGLSVISRKYGKEGKVTKVNYAVYPCVKKNFSKPIEIKDISVIAGVPGKIMNYKIGKTNYCSYRL